MKKVIITTLIALSPIAFSEEINEFKGDHDLYNHKVCDLKDVSVKSRFRDLDSDLVINKEMVDDKCVVKVNVDISVIKKKIEMKCTLNEKQHEIYARMNKIKDKMFFEDKSEDELIAAITSAEGFEEVKNIMENPEVCNIKFEDYPKEG